MYSLPSWQFLELMPIIRSVMSIISYKSMRWSRTDLTDIEGGYGVFLGLFGAIAGGLLADKFGPKRVASFGCIVLAASYAIFGLSSPETGIVPWFDWDDKNIVIGYVLMTTWMEAMIATSMFAMCMTVSWPKVAATQFTAYMAILNLSINFFGLLLAGELVSYNALINPFV